MVRNDKRNGYAHAPVVSLLVGGKVGEETHVGPSAPAQMGWPIEPGMVYILHLLVGWRGCIMHMYNVNGTQRVAEWCSHTGYFEVWEETERCSGPWVKRLRHITPACRSVPRPPLPPPPASYVPVPVYRLQLAHPCSSTLVDTITSATAGLSVSSTFPTATAQRESYSTSILYASAEALFA
jgi:hypothetical protein